MLLIFRFMDADALDNFEISCKVIRDQVVMCSAWKCMVSRDYPRLYKDKKFDERYSEHVFYKKACRMFWLVGHNCYEDCYNCATYV